MEERHVLDQQGERQQRGHPGSAAGRIRRGRRDGAEQEQNREAVELAVDAGDHDRDGIGEEEQSIPARFLR